MRKIQVYRGYEIKAFSQKLGLPSNGFMRYGSISMPGNTVTLEPGGEIYNTEGEAEDAFFEYAKGYIDYKLKQDPSWLP